MKNQEVTIQVMGVTFRAETGTLEEQKAAAAWLAHQFRHMLTKDVSK